MLGANHSLGYPPPLPKAVGSAALPGAGYVLVPVAGQSNAQSFAQNSPVTAFPSGVLQISRAGATSGSFVDNVLIPAAHPVDSVGGTGTFYNFADAFAVRFLADPANAGKTLVFLFAAEGATSIADGQTWSAVPSAGARLSDMVSRINTFFTNYPGAEMGGFLWHQGESTTTLAYMRLFEKMRAHVIASCPRVTATTPWVVGGRVLQPQILAFLAQSVFPETIRYTAFVDSTGTTSVGDNVHFDKASLDIMGDRYYDGWLEAIANSDVNLGFDQPYGFRDFTNNTWTAQGMSVTSIAGGHNFAMVAGASPRRGWQIIPAGGLVLYTPYRVRFTAERDDPTDNIDFGFGALQNFTSARQSLAMPANTPTSFDFEIITTGSTFSNGFYFGLISDGGPTATNVKITNLRVTRTIEE